MGDRYGKPNMVAKYEMFMNCSKNFKGIFKKQI